MNQEQEPVDLDRFLKKVRYCTKTGCWLWTAAKNYGYGVFALGNADRVLMKRKTISAHRWSYLNIIGPIPKNLHLDHLCRNRSCVNPRHLEPVTCRENLLRGKGSTASFAKRSHCGKGHVFSIANTYWRKDKKHTRICRICNRENAARIRAKKKGSHESKPTR